MGILEMSAELEIEFIDNWDTFTAPETIEVKYPDRQFNTDGKSQFIALNFMALDDDLIGFDGTTTGRIEYAGKLYVSCFHKTRKLALKLADTVTEFLRGKELPQNVHVLARVGNSPTRDLPNDFHEIVVSFDVRQC